MKQILHKNMDLLLLDLEMVAEKNTYYTVHIYRQF